jgi:SpoVK/Ycf46/Vps4 family AAA+-type ATPase
VQSTLTELLDRHATATGHRKKRDLNAITAQYDITALNVDIPPVRIIRGLQSFWNTRNHDAPDRKDGNMNLLFWGAPGTGKTEYAKFLAESLSANLMVKRASDLISMWVGGTEANIKAAFEEAARDRAILFLDEADSFFINRETAVRSWETSQTNELLTQMENHKGVLICCTNLLEHLDRAVARRFIWKVHFKALSPEGKISLYQKYFAESQEPVPSSLHRRIAAIHELTPGDIKVVWQKFQFAGEEERHHEQIVEELEKEVAYKNGGHNDIGFCA